MRELLATGGRTLAEGALDFGPSPPDAAAEINARVNRAPDGPEEPQRRQASAAPQKGRPI